MMPCEGVKPGRRSGLNNGFTGFPLTHGDGIVSLLPNPLESDPQKHTFFELRSISLPVIPAESLGRDLFADVCAASKNGSRPSPK